MKMPIAERQYAKSIYLLFFLSGFTGLVYEVLWTRMFALVFGATSFAISTVLAAFMGGLALGSFYFGRLIDRRGNPLRIYALLELFLCIYVLILPFLISLLNNVYAGFYRLLPASFLTMSIIRFILSFIVLIIPTTLMGGTLPVLSKFMVTRQDSVGLKVGSLYSINTVGGAIGCLATGFILIASIGIRYTIYVTAGINLVIGLIAMVLSGRIVKVTETSVALPTEESVKAQSVRLMTFAFGFSGFAALAYEVLWTRVLSLILGTTVYAFSTMLTAFLCGLALGGFIFSRFIDRSRRLVLIFSCIQIAIGCLGILSIFMFSRLPFLVLGMVKRLGGSWRDFTFIQFVMAFLVMLIPTILMGATFPVVSRICTRQMRLLGRSIGNIYSANTVGAILGSLASGFLMIPLIGIQNSIKLTAFINVLVGLIVLISLEARTFGFSRGRIYVSAAVIFAVFSILLTIPTWNREVMTSGVYFEPLQYIDRNREVDLKTRLMWLKLLYYAEGLDGIVTVYSRGPELSLMINGIPLASNIRDDISLLGMMAHLPLMLHGVMNASPPQSVMVIGLGAGVTAGMAAQCESVSRVDCVELERKVTGAAKYFEHENRHVLNNPKLKLIIDDGRSFVQRTANRYDIITSDPIHPWISGAGSLYAVEHFQYCKKRLNKGGVVAQWLPLYEMPERDFKTVIRTFQTVFPHTSLWLTDTDSILIGTEERLKIDYRAMELKFQDEKIQEDMRIMYVDSLQGLLTMFTMGEDDLLEYTTDARLNTDAHPVLEFSAPVALYSETVARNMDSIGQNMKPVIPFLYNLGDERETSDLKQELLKNFEEKKHILQSQTLDLRSQGE